MLGYFLHAWPKPIVSIFTNKPKMDRRRLITLGTAGMMSDYDFLAQSFALEIKLKSLALKYQMIRGPVSVLDKFKTLKTAGFKGVEISMAQYKEAKEILVRRSYGIWIHGVVHGSSDTRNRLIRCGWGKRLGRCKNKARCFL